MNAKATRTTNPLHFEDLEPHRFEDLVRDILYNFKDWHALEATGRSGNDHGIDIRGIDYPSFYGVETEDDTERVWFIQCKRYKSLRPGQVRDIVQDNLGGQEKKPFAYMLVAACNFSKDAYDAFREEVAKFGVQRWLLWGKAELETQLKLEKNHYLLHDYFGLSGRDLGEQIQATPELPPPDKLPEPGKLPPGSRLPFVRNAIFTGRKEDLLALAKYLVYDPKGHDMVVTAVTTGMGGIGKSQLAVEFCYRYGRFFDGVHWIQADQDIQAEIAICGAAMGITPWPNEIPDQVLRTLLTWQNSEKRLIILDNAETPEQVQEWLPKLGHLRVLLTSRRRKWPADLGLTCYPLDTLERDKSLTLLRKLADRLNAVPNVELGKLADQLGDLPLALDLAGRYLAKRRLTVAEYLEEINGQEVLLQHISMRNWSKHNPTQHETNVVKTFGVSWDTLDNKNSKKGFIICGYCASNTEVPWDLLEKVLDIKGDELDKALNELENLGLVTLGTNGPYLHPLLTEFGMGLDKDQENLPGVVKVISDLGLIAIDSGFPNKFIPLREHIVKLAITADQMGLSESWILWYLLGHHLRIIGDFYGAKVVYERALNITEEILDPDNIEVAILINNIGRVDEELGNLRNAKTYYERSLQIAEKSLERKNPTFISLLNNLGRVLHEMGDLHGAKYIIDRAIDIHEKEIGCNTPMFATLLGNLAGVLKDFGDIVGSKSNIERALGITMDLSGPNHPDVAILLNNLSTILMDMDDFKGAKSAVDQALKIDEAVYGFDHPYVAIRVRNQGGVWLALGEYYGAKNAFKRALKINETYFGPNHPKVIDDLNALGGVLIALGDHVEAKVIYERVLKIDETLFGPNHPNVALDINNLGLALKGLGDIATAKANFERALSILRKYFPEDHPHVKIIRGNLESLDRESPSSQ